MSSGPAEFSKTVIYSAEVKNKDGEVRHVLGYQNHADNISRGPNAMILPIPADTVSRDNVVDASDFSDVLDIYSEAVEKLRNRSRSFTRLTLSYSASLADVFESGSYTIVLATEASQITEALERVPANKRPSISKELVDSLGKLYEGWPIAVCCFDGNKVAPEPMIWEFKPKFENILFAPALDAHTGGAPDLKANVQRSHKLAFHSYKMNLDTCLNTEIEYSDVPDKLLWLFGTKIKGAIVEGKTPNGDFAITIQDLISGKENIKSNLKVTVGA